MTDSIDRTLAADKARETEIRRLAASHNLGALAGEHIVKGTSVADFRGIVLQHLRAIGSTKPLEAPPAAIGLSDTDARAFSISRLIAAELDPNQRRHAGFEREVTSATFSEMQARGFDPKGIALPLEVVRAQLAPWMDPGYQARTTTVGGTGSNLVQNTVAANGYIAPNYIQPRVVEAGAVVMNGLVGNVKLPKMSAGVTAGWVATENATLSNSDPTFAQVSLTPRDLGAYVDISRRLVLQSQPGADQLIMADLGRQIAITIDAGALNGTNASGQPQGLAGAGINLNPVGTNGGPMTWALATSSVQSVAAANLLGGKLGWITSAQGRLHLARTVKVASYPEYLLDAPDYASMLGYPVLASQNVLANISKGTGTNLTQLFFGDWSQLVIGLWGGGVDLLIDPYTFSSTGAVRIRAMASVDVGVRYTGAFSLVGDVNPA